LRRLIAKAVGYRLHNEIKEKGAPESSFFFAMAGARGVQKAKNDVTAIGAIRFLPDCGIDLSADNLCSKLPDLS
jgi:hypothetical protein